MQIEEIQGDLFSADLRIYSKPMYAHCISADFALDAGIAKGFNKRFDMSKKLSQKFACCKGTPDLIGTSCPVENTFNLVTKWRYWEKPKIDNLELSIIHMRKQCYMYKVTDILMPRIGSGLDRLDWNKVKSILNREFSDTDISIHIYYLK